MKTPSLGALPHAVLAGRARRTTRRAFHSIRSYQYANGAGSGAKPADEATTIQDNELESSIAPESTVGRTRNLASGPLRSRQARRRTPSALPPIELSSSFLSNNISIFTAANPPRLPEALVEDSTREKTSRLSVEQAPLSRQSQPAMEFYFQTALTMLLLRDCELATELDCLANDSSVHSQDWLEHIERVTRVWDMILDSAWHLVDLICQAGHIEYTYKVRPFWWWHIYKDLDPRTKRLKDRVLTPSSLEAQIRYAETLIYPLAHAVTDLPVETLSLMQKGIQRELYAESPCQFNPKTSKRPITVLSMTGFGGKAVAEAVGQHLAFWSRADLIHLDAQDLSVLVGDYLGSNWAYSRSSLSMLGYRTAELNGKLSKEAPNASVSPDDDEMDGETNIVNLRTAYGSLEDELQKIKQGDYDCFSKWDNLKIDKLLDHIIHATEQAPTLGEVQRPVLLHLHDVVELSMTLEGSLLIGRLRALVDAAWQQGKQIALFATSSCAQPSSEYQDATKQLAAVDLVITRHLEAIAAESRGITDGRLAGNSFSLQEADYFFENIRNINRMMRGLDGHGSLDIRPFDENIAHFLRSSEPRYKMLRDTVLPAPEIYNLACAIKDLESQVEGTGPTAFSERCAMGSLTQKPGQELGDEDKREAAIDNGERQRGHEEPKSEGRGAAKLNEYEKRVSSGQINRENLRTTFADVHVPQETISALRLMTSLALIRPDAFAYGVLAQDRIAGCLLYGPPGTGKTMLAKAVAKESGANMLEISGATINDKWVGESEKLIRAVFTLAKRLEPCIVFIDEADALLASRSMFSNRASHREHINQFLKEWDGMEETNAFIMVATNRPFDLDDAVLRRLPRKILVDLPLRDDRLAILRLLLRGELLDGSVSLEKIAEQTGYYSGSDLKNVCVAAAMAAVQEEVTNIKLHDGMESPYPDRRILRSDHFENALKQIPASISEDMATLKQIRKFDDQYGSRRGTKKKSSMGFGVLDDKTYIDSAEARIRP